MICDRHCGSLSWRNSRNAGQHRWGLVSPKEREEHEEGKGRQLDDWWLGWVGFRRNFPGMLQGCLGTNRQGSYGEAPVSLGAAGVARRGGAGGELDVEG